MMNEFGCKGCDCQFTLDQISQFIQGFCHGCTEQRINTLKARVNALENRISLAFRAMAVGRTDDAMNHLNPDE